MQKDFITVTPDSGSGSATVTVSASVNSGQARSSSIAISGGVVKRTVEIAQESKYETFADISYSLNPTKVAKLTLESQTDTNVVEINPNSVENIGFPKGFNHLFTYIKLSGDDNLDMKLRIKNASVSNVKIGTESLCAMNISNEGNEVEILVYGDYEAIEYGGWACDCICDLTINGYIFTNVTINCDCLD